MLVNNFLILKKQFFNHLHAAVRLVVLLSSLLLAFPLSAQLEPGGARAEAMSGAYVALANTADALFVNPAGLTRAPANSITLFYQRPFGLTDLNYGALSGNFSILSLQAGFGAVSLTSPLFSEQTFVGALAHNFRNRLHYGIAASFWRTSIQGYGSSGSLSLDLGLLFPVSHDITFGMSAHNLNRASRGSDPLPQRINSGFSFKTSQRLILNFEIHKETKFDPEMRYGVELLPFKALAIRAGTANNPRRFSAGFGFSFKNVNIDYAFLTHNELGVTHKFSLTFSFKKRILQIEKSDPFKPETDAPHQLYLGGKHGILVPININTAWVDQLTELPGIGKRSAEYIIAYRKQHGSFVNKADLQNVKTIGSAVYEKIELLITINDKPE